MKTARLLYLGLAAPPRVQRQHPEFSANSRFQAQMMAEVGKHFDVRSVSALPFAAQPAEAASGQEPGGPEPDLLLVDKPPELFHWWNSLRQLRHQVRQWRQAEWSPDVVLVYNFSPIYNAFVRGLGQLQAKRVLLLGDSATLGREWPWLKRLRYRLKPFAWPEEQMLPHFDACISLSRGTEALFARRRLPWLWMPGGCDPTCALPASAEPGDGPIRFGYFGSLAPHAGLMSLLKAFSATAVPGPLHVCGPGKQAPEIAQRCAADPRLQFHGLLPMPEDCLRFAQGCDVLVNPRPLIPGNENNFPSKTFEYALSGRAILTTGFAGVTEVLGPAAFYLDEAALDSSLAKQLVALSRMPRAELNQRGRKVQERVMTEFTWARQAAHMAEFILSLPQA
jgi:glycosyltransferase involved in cell wall biosynthesis